MNLKIHFYSIDSNASKGIGTPAGPVGTMVIYLYKNYPEILHRMNRAIKPCTYLPVPIN